MRKSGDYLVFPGGGTQFKDGVTHYIEYIQKVVRYAFLVNALDVYFVSVEFEFVFVDADLAEY